MFVFFILEITRFESFNNKSNKPFVFDSSSNKVYQYFVTEGVEALKNVFLDVSRSNTERSEDLSKGCMTAFIGPETVTVKKNPGS